MKLREYKDSDAEYNIGLDAGTASAGWSVVDDVTGELCYFKGKPTWGSRLYPEAAKASEARSHRSQRRLISRRRQRLNLLQEIFNDEMHNVDAGFFKRLNNAFRVMNDKERNFKHPIFNDSDFSENEYYKRFPTIYHLRNFLMESEEKQDLRLVYLAFHNIVKCRGNFLYEDVENLSAKDADVSVALDNLELAVNDFYEQKGLEGFDFSLDKAEFKKIVGDGSKKREDKRGAFKELFSGLITSESAIFVDKKLPVIFAGAVLGYSVDFNKIFGEPDAPSKKFKFGDEEEVEKFAETLDDGLALFEALQATYSSIILVDILKNQTSISKAKIKSYDEYQEDLKLLKELVREYNPKEFYNFFRGPLYEDASGYDPAKAHGYTLYNLKRGVSDREKFLKEVKKVLEPATKSGDKRCMKVLERIEEDAFLKRQKTGESGAIPFQLHLEEMNAIVDKQKEFYPFLSEEREKLNSLVKFRIPYYVGPLTVLNARKDSQGKNRFAWSERHDGKKFEKAYPWNWEDVIDKDKSAEKFMKRMIGTCTYIYDEPVLPKCSLKYEFFCVLNELNGARWNGDGEKEIRFDTCYRQGIIKDLFMKKRHGVSYKQVAEWIKSQNCVVQNVKVSGGQGETAFVSKLKSWNDFCEILDVETLDSNQQQMAEEIILWKSLFQDKEILKRKISCNYGNVLSKDQIKKIMRKNYSGWGNLSERLLFDLKAQTDSGDKSIMDILWEGNQNNSRGSAVGSSQVFMEIYHDDFYRFDKQVDDLNAKKAKELSVETMQGSPALKRTVNQCLRIVEEIVRLAGKPPKNIFIEYTRDDDARKKGKWTKRRYDNIKAALENFKNDDPDVWSEFKSKCNDDLADDRLALYFMQRGKCMYSGRELDINNLHLYQVDHILPQCYIKDDSFDNKVLVYPEENQRKLDNLLLDAKVQKKMADFWAECKRVDLISEKKYRNLTRDRISDKSLKGFIARQLVETNQIVKFMKDLLQQEYPETNVHFVKASVTSGLRRKCGFVKCREINDFHHAHDAYLACRVGMFIQKRHSDAYENPIKMSKAVRDFVKVSAAGTTAGNIPGSDGFFVTSFLRSGFDKETGEIFNDDWDAEEEVERIRKVLDYKQVFISRMVEEKAGAYWDANIISPRSTKNKLQIKKGLETQKYGSYNNLNPAYGFVYLCKDKNGRKKIRIASVPIFKSEKFKDVKCLEAYAESLCTDNKETYSRILRERIRANQLLECEGNLFYYVSPKEVKNAKQIAFSQNETRVIKSIYEGEILDTEVVDSLLTRIFNFFQHSVPEQYRKFKGDVLRENFLSVEQEKKVELLKVLLALSKNEIDRFNSKPFGGTSVEAGRMGGYSLEKRATKLVIVDQSITGMLEKRTRLVLE